MSGDPFTAEDVADLHRRGVSLEEAERQIALLSGRERFVDVTRPATVGDGIARLDPRNAEELEAMHAGAARSGRFVKFVPASGAATRMFGALLAFHHGKRGPTELAELATFVAQLDRFPFRDDLVEVLRARGLEPEAEALLAALFDADGLGYADRAKGLLKFHRYPDGSRTAFEEHLVEAADYARDSAGLCRLHFTVSRRDRAAFERAAERGQERFGNTGLSFEVSFSHQKPSTGTLVLDGDGRPLRDAAGRLVLRPGGHGALIANLAEIDSDLVYIKNIDNVQPDRAKPTATRWKRLLGGWLVKLEREARRLVESLREPRTSPELVERAARFARDELFDRSPEGPATLEARRARLIGLLNRPLRVCGVVRNTGEPGGGPFWVRGTDGGESLQLVEKSELNPEDERHVDCLRRSSHFNPVDLVCALCDVERRPFDLVRFVDHGAVIVTRKLEAGREHRVLERPGLWNGAMAGWNTVFVEVPIETFTPVKSVFDLLRDEHR